MSLNLKKWLGALSALAMISSMGSVKAQTNGLLGEYYVVDPINPSRPPRGLLFGCKLPTFNRIDPSINFNWGANPPNDAENNPPPEVSPGVAFPGEHFAARWTGTLTPDAANSGNRVIIANSDDGMRVWIKDKAQGPISGSEAPVNDQWNDQGGGDRPGGTINFEVGKQYYVLVEYYENGGGAQAMLKWRTPEQTDAESVPVPTTLLTPATPPTPPGPDNVAPGAPSALTASNVTNDSATLTFTASGNDGATGTAGCYEIRYSNSPLNEANFTRGTELGTTLLPDAAGASQNFRITGLQQIEHYWIALRARDIAGNVGPVSNVADFTTLVEPPPTLPAGTDGQAGITAYLYTNTPQTNADRLSAMFRPNLFKQAEVVTAIDQHDTVRDTYPNYPQEKGLNVEAYAIRYAFTMKFNAAASFYFNGYCDDGVRVWFSETPINVTVPGAPVLQNWAGHGQTDAFSPQINAQAGKTYYVLMEYYESGGGADAQLKMTDIPDDPAVATQGAAEGEIVSTTPALFDYTLGTYYLKASDFPPLGRLRGQLVNSDGTTAPNGIVTYTLPGNTTATNSRVNAFGTYSFLVPPGAYPVSAVGSTASGVTGTGSLAAPANVTAGVSTPDQNITLAPKALLANTLPKPVDKAVYREPGYNFTGQGWINNAGEDTNAETGELLADRIVNFFTGKGFTAVDSTTIVTFMQNHITSKAPSVVVMADDIFPSTVVNVTDGVLGTTNHLVRTYLENGGRIVSFADIPFYYIATEEFTSLTPNPGGNGAVNVLGFNAQNGAWDQNDQPTVTGIGAAMGLSPNTWIRSLRPTLPSEVDVTLANGLGGSAGFMKLFGTADNAGSFIRLLDYNPTVTVNPITDTNLADIQKVAEFGGALPVGPVTPPPGCKGDANGDKKIDVNDAVAILRHATSISLLTGQARVNADIDGPGTSDASVNVADAVKVLQFIVNIPGTGISACQ